MRILVKSPKFFFLQSHNNCGLVSVMGIRKKILHALTEKNMSQRELAKKLGMSPGSFSRIVMGKVQPTLPTLQKIARGLGKSLEYFDEGYDPRKSLEPPKGYTRVPILGSAPAGEKISADDYIEGYVDLPIDSSSGKELYLLYVHGDSMVQAGLRDGGKVIVQYNKEPKNGDIVVARIDGEYTIKYFYNYSDTVVLRPANPAYEEQTYKKGGNEIETRGVVIGVLF